MILSYSKEQPAEKPVHCMIVKESLNDKDLSCMLVEMEQEKNLLESSLKFMKTVVEEMKCCGNCTHKDIVYLDDGYVVDGEVCKVTGDWIKNSSVDCNRWILDNER